MKSCRQQILGEKWKAKGNQQIWTRGQKIMKKIPKIKKLEQNFGKDKKSIEQVKREKE